MSRPAPRPVAVAAALTIAGLVAAMGVVPARAQAARASLDGAGDTFAQVLINNLGPELAAGAGAFDLDYLGQGSQAKDDFAKGELDFVLDQTPLTTAQVSALNASGTGFAYAPLALGAIAFPYNVITRENTPRVIDDLKLSPKTVVAIFTGTDGGGAQAWASPEITADNGRKLETQPTGTRRVARLDPSGTTEILTDWFLKVDPATWVAFVKAQKTPNPDQPQLSFPDNGGVTSRTTGDSGLVDLIRKQFNAAPGGFGSIGYASSANTKESKVTVARIRNSSGDYVEPTADAMAAAIRSAKINADNTVTLDLNPPAAGAYPLTVVSYAIVRTTGLTPAKRAAMVRFLRTASGTGQDKAAALGYAPLPKALNDLTIAVADRLNQAAAAGTTTSTTRPAGATTSTTRPCVTSTTTLPTTTTLSTGATTSSTVAGATNTSSSSTTSTTRASGVNPRIGIRSVMRPVLLAQTATTTTTPSTTTTLVATTTTTAGATTTTSTGPTTTTTRPTTTTSTPASSASTTTVPCTTTTTAPPAPAANTLGTGDSLALTGVALALPIGLAGLAFSLGGEVLRRRAGEVVGGRRRWSRRSS